MFIVFLIFLLKGLGILWVAEWAIVKISHKWRVHYYVMNISIWVVMAGFMILGVPSIMPANFASSLILQGLVFLAYKKEVGICQKLMHMPADLKK